MPLGGMGRTIAIWVVTTLPAVPPVRKQKSIAFSMLSPPQPAVTSGTPRAQEQRQALNDRERGLGENGVEDEHVCQGGISQAVTGKSGAVEFIPLRRLV